MPDQRLRVPKPRVARYYNAATVLAVVVALLSIGGMLWVQQGRIDVGVDRYNSLNAKYDRLFTQYSRLYGDCAEASNCEPTAPAPEAIPGPQGSAGATGATGAAGPRGEKGDIGIPGQTGPQGPAGEAGESGATGAQGDPGPSGAQGPAGASGPAGPAGATGPAGADGQPPLSWTYTDALGLSYICTRTDPFDPAVPTYSCASSSAMPSP